MHREQQRRAVEEDDREHVERVVEQVAVADRERRGPVEVREDAERHRLAPAAHQHRADEAQHQIEPDRRGEGPGDMGAHAERPGPPVDPHPPEQDRGGQEEAGHQPPAALAERRQDAQAVLRAAAARAPARAAAARTATGSQFTEAHMLSPMISMAMKPQSSDGDAERSPDRSGRPARRRSCPSQ